MSKLFLFLEGDGVVCLENIVALIREEHETAILTRDNTVHATGFTPATLRKRSEQFWNVCVTRKEKML